MDNTITPDLLESKDKAFEVAQPEASPLPDLNALRTDFGNLLNPGNTPTQDKESDLLGQVEGLQNQLSGESEFRTGLEDEQDIAGKQQVVNDLTGQLGMLIAENKQIPLQLQQDAKGRGITEGGLAPIQAGALRKNAINALGVSAMLEASQGNLSTAQSLVDRAVAAEFDPIRAKINAKIANLDLIQGKLNREQTDQANAAKLALEERNRMLDIAQTNKQEIFSLSALASENGAPQDVVSDALKSKSSFEALNILRPYMKDPEIAKNRIFNEKVQTLQLSLAQNKFDEDKRQFDLQYALEEKQILEKMRTDALAASATGEISEYAQERITRNLNSIEDLRALATQKSVGFAVLLNKVPTSEALTFKKKLQTLKANIAFGEITAMREASKTGGALGQVSERELALLEAALGGIDQAMSVEDFNGALDEIQGSIIRWRDASTNNQSSTGEFVSESGTVYSLPY